MSPEWMFALDRVTTTARGRNRNRLADPLEREEWKGFGALIDLFVRLSRHRRRRASNHAPFGGFGRPCQPLAASRRN